MLFRGKKTTKSEAYARFLKFKEKYPPDKWVILGGHNPQFNMYSGTVRRIGQEKYYYFFFAIEIRRLEKSLQGDERNEV